MATSASSKLALVVDIVRHGARSAAAGCPFFPHITWQTHGELTSLGESQQLLLGQRRRAQYVEGARLLPSSYQPGTLHVRSTNMSRTIMSAEKYLMGMYPELAEPRQLVQTVDYHEESLLLTTGCKFVTDNFKNYFASKDYFKLITHTHNATWSRIMAAYPSITMQHLLAPANAFYLADFLLCAAADGRLPAGLTSGDAEELKKFIGDTLAGVDRVHPLMNKIGMQGLSQEIIEFMDGAISGKSKVKYVLYSGHDITEIVVLDGLRRMDPTIQIEKVPDFAASILFELESDRDDSNTVTVHYDGKVIHRQPYSEFSKRFRALGDIGSSRQAVCKLKTGEDRQGFFVPFQSKLYEEGKGHE